MQMSWRDEKQLFWRSKSNCPGVSKSNYPGEAKSKCPGMSKGCKDSCPSEEKINLSCRDGSEELADLKSPIYKHSGFWLHQLRRWLGGAKCKNERFWWLGEVWVFLSLSTKTPLQILSKR